MARILLADDDKATRDLVKRALESEGHRVQLSEDGAEARAALDAGSYDLVVSDVEMPGVDGIALARHALAASQSVKLLLMSGYVDALDRARQLGSGRVGVIAKPFTLEQFRKAIRDML